MIRSIRNQTSRLKALLVGQTLIAPNGVAPCRTMIGLARTGNGISRLLCAAALLGPMMLLPSGSVSTSWADVTINDDKSVRVGDIQADLGALGTETSNATLACWQGGKEIFTAEEFNTVLLGGLAGESAITMKNNTNGAQALAISLDNGLCFVTIAP